MQKDLSGRFIPGKTRIKYGGAVTGKAERRAIERVLDRNWWTLDEQGKLFEKELAKASRVKHAVLTNSGSSALLIAFSSLDLPPGSEVIIPAVNFPTAVSATLVNGYKPVFVDVDLGTLCLDLSLIKKAINNKTRAILAVAIAGNVPNLERLQEIAKKLKLVTILDNCDGYGSTFAGKPVEAFVDVAVTSMHAAHIIAMGEGGTVFTNRDDLGRRAVSLREWGRARDSDVIAENRYPGLPKDYPARYTYITRGFNLKPLELQAAMGRVQLRRLKRIKQQRADNFKKLYKGLLGFGEWLDLPVVHKKASISWFSFPIICKEGVSRGELMGHLESKNIETRVIFAGNIIHQPAYSAINYRKYGDLKNSDAVLRGGFFISVHPNVTREMIDYIISSFREFFQK